MPGSSSASSSVPRQRTRCPRTRRAHSASLSGKGLSSGQTSSNAKGGSSWVPSSRLTTHSPLHPSCTSVALAASLEPPSCRPSTRRPGGGRLLADLVTHRVVTLAYPLSLRNDLVHRPAQQLISPGMRCLL